MSPNEFADTVEDPTHYGTVKNPDTSDLAKSSADGLSELEFPSDQQATDDDPEPYAESAITESGITEPAMAESADDDLPDPLWLEDAGRQRRRWLLAGAAMLTGIGLAVAVFIYLASRSATQVAEKTPNSVPGSVPSVGENSTTNPKEGDAAGNLTELPADGSPRAAAAPTVDPSAPDLGPQDDNPVPPANSVAPAVHPETPPSTIPPPPPAPPSEKRPTAAPGDLVPENDEKAKADRMTPGGSLSETLRKLGGLFDETGDGSEPEPPPEPVTTTAAKTDTPDPLP
jgi:hypothetical protein